MIKTIGSLILSTTLAFQAVAQDAPQSDAEIVSAACQSNGDFIIIDTFRQRQPDFGYNAKQNDFNQIDIDGDGIADVLHGDMTSVIAEAQGLSITTYGLKEHNGRYIQGAFGDIKHFINIGQIKKPAGIIIPASFSVTLESLNLPLLPDGTEISLSNIREYREYVSNHILRAYGPESPQGVIHSIIQDFHDMGIPIITSAGNDYSQRVNVAGIMGAVTIGASPHSSPAEQAPYSNQSSLTNVFSNGDIISTRTPDGVDINNDSETDFYNTQLSSNESIGEKYNGRTPAISQIEQVRQNPQQEAFLDVEDYYRAMGITEHKTIDDISRLYGSVIHYPSGTIFKMGDDGQLAFDPADNGNNRQIALNFGTSFSVVNLCEQSASETYAAYDF